MQSFTQNTPMQCKVPQEEGQAQSYLEGYYPEINLSNEIHSLSSARSSSFLFDAGVSVLRPVNEGPLKRIFRTFYENGFTAALNAARDLKTNDSNTFIASIAQFTYHSLEYCNKLKAKIFLKTPGVECIADYVETRDWNRSYIRCMSWHPHVFKIAIAGVDDIIRVYTDESSLRPVLKSAAQKSITSMAWRPVSTGELAVGCADGVCLWNLESAHITRALMQDVVLKHRNHFPVTSVAWSENGVLLATVSISSSDILIWNVDKGQNMALQRSIPTCTFLKWAPDDSVIFSATTNKVFRVWHTQKSCGPERWILNSGRVQSACWSPCGTILLYVTTQDSCLYRLQYQKALVFNTDVMENNVQAIADLSKCTTAHRDVGGLPQAIIWDSRGRYVAVSFKDTPCVAIFSTSFQHNRLNIAPTCFLTGLGAEFPACIDFQNSYSSNQDVVLTIGWSSGRLQFYPLNYI